MTETYDLLLAFDCENSSLDTFAEAFFSAAGVGVYSERESVHYIEERYFKGESDGVIFKVMRSDDEDHADLSFWVDIEVVDPSYRGFQIDDFVRRRLLGRGFRVARLLNIGRVDEKRQDY